MGRASTVTDDEIAAALVEHGNHRRHTAAALRCSEARIANYCFTNDIPNAKRRAKKCNSYLPKVYWTPENIMRLRTLYLDDRLSVGEIAVKFGTTPTGIQTAMSRSGLTRIEHRQSLHPQYQNPGSGDAVQERRCLCCRLPFISTGRGNRQCVRCFEENSRIAA